MLPDLSASDAAHEIRVKRVRSIYLRRKHPVPVDSAITRTPLEEYTVKTNRKALAALSIVAASALALTACSSGSKDSGNESGSGDAAAAVITTNGTEPQNPLIPSNTTEVGGGKIINLIFAGLTSFDASGAPQMDQAESVTPNADNTQYTVKLKEGLKFTDGTPVTADSFIKAWTWSAKLGNAQSASYFFDNIKGYNAEKDAELTGLKKVSDTEFTVDLINPESDFTKRIGYSAFVPLPESFYKDTKAFGESPVGNGSYKLASEKAWTHNKGIELVTNPDYKGARVAKNGGVNITFYTNEDAAYADVQGQNLDVLDTVPASALKNYESDFPDSKTNKAAAVFQSFTIPQYLEHFKPGEEGQLRRQALSLAIDRDTITDKIFQGTRQPAKDFTSPALEGWETWGKTVAGNDVFSLNVEKAKELWAKADAISKYEGKFTISYNADGPHEEWVTAVTNSLKQNLGIEAEPKAYASFKQLLDDENNDKMTGAFRSGWQADYPAMYNFLAPLYQTGASSNYGRYTSKVVDNALKAGSAAKTPEEATAEYTKAQAELVKDLPAIPLWYQNVTGVWNPDVKNVEFGWDSVALYHEITK